MIGTRRAAKIDNTLAMSKNKERTKSIGITVTLSTSPELPGLLKDVCRVIRLARSTT